MKPRYGGNLNAHKPFLLKVSPDTWHNKTVITSKHMLPRGRYSSKEPYLFAAKQGMKTLQVGPENIDGVLKF